MEASDLCYTQVYNISCRRPSRSHFTTLLIYIMISAISLVTVVLILLVVIAISHFRYRLETLGDGESLKPVRNICLGLCCVSCRQLHTPTNILLLSLAIFDCLVGLLMFFQMMLIDGCWFLGDFMCLLYQCLACDITAASLGSMVIISIDHYVAICYPLHYSTKITHQRVQVCVCLCWMCSLLFQCLNWMDSLVQPGRYNACVGECVFANQVTALADLILSFIFPITVIVVLYMRVFVVAISQTRAMRSQLVQAGPHRVTAKRSEMKAARALGTVIAVFLICMCPFYCVSLSGQESALDSSLAGFVGYLFYFNSCLNPAIYAFFYPLFRQSIRLVSADSAT